MLGVPAITVHFLGHAAEQLVKEISSRSAIDVHCADQILPFLALCGGEIKASSVSEHARTNMWVIEKFLDVKFEVEGNMIRVLQA